MKGNPDSIITKRLLLRPLTRTELSQYVPGPAAWAATLDLKCELQTLDRDTQEAILKDLFPYLTEFNACFLSLWIMIDFSSSVIVGSFCFHGLPSEGKVEIGYGVHPHSQGMGYMTEALIGIVDWLKTRQEVDCLVVETAPGNRASIRILEKAGFSCLGIRGENLGYSYQIRQNTPSEAVNKCP
jgi:RimJ/RimL family protein N-acetyltransferase